MEKIDYPTLIWRHRKERLSKCSLRGLEHRRDLSFYQYPNQSLPDLSHHILLTLDAPLLTKADQGFGLLLLDATWRYAGKMEKSLNSEPAVRRSLPPGFQTAYPRRQGDPRGLASVEALYLAYQILGHPTDGLLDHYRWTAHFLDQNAAPG